jgi:geranylgeranyl diphosphate synthase, type I
MAATAITNGMVTSPAIEHTMDPRGELRAMIGARWTAGPDSLDAICAYALAIPGKLFRPILLLESAKLVGGEISEVMPAAVGTECGHVASLIHDDIIDRDDMRRGREAVHRRFGADGAIVAGDALIFDSFLGLAQCLGTGAPETRIVAALEAAARGGIEMCRGQALEAEICARRILDADAYLRMISMKTAAFFRYACKGGAILAGAPTPWVDRLGDYGEHLGIAFQIWDDLLPYLGNDVVTGKPAASDIRNGRLTLPIIMAYRDGTADDSAVLDAALAGRLEHDVLPAVTSVLCRTGAIEDCSRLAREHAIAARDALAVFPHSPSRDVLAVFATRAVDREA